MNNDEENALRVSLFVRVLAVIPFLVSITGLFSLPFVIYLDEFHWAMILALLLFALFLHVSFHVLFKGWAPRYMRFFA
jgi:hypothetical protein